MNRRTHRACIIVSIALIASSAYAALDQSMRFIEEPVEGEYDVLCPIVIDGTGELRVAFDARTDSGDMAWVRIADGEASLHRSEGGSETSVGDPAPVKATGPGELTIQRRADRVRVIVAGELVLDEPWDAPSGGDVGVGSSGRYVASKPSAQPVDPPFVTDDFTREAEAMGLWETSGGDFVNTMIPAEGAVASMSTNPFSLHVESEGDAVATTGYWFWDSYIVRLNVKPIATASVELRAWVQDDANYLALRWEPGDADTPGARRLVLVRDGVERVLDQAPGGYLPGEWYRMELRVTPGRVEALIDREATLAANTPALAQGAVGLALASGDAYFDDLLVAPPGYREAPPHINPVFLTDEVMIKEELYIPSGFWRAGDESGQYWHWGEFFDDARVTIPVDLLTADGLGVLLRSDGANVGAGYRVDLALSDGQVAISLARNGTPVASETTAMEAEEPMVVTVAGDAVTVTQGGRALMRHADPEPLSGHQVALLDAPNSAVNVVNVQSDHFEDYIFDRAPTDWFAGKGTWGVTSRWPCTPDWTFYGGAGVENPLVWSKHTYNGDMVLEWFGAIESDNVNRIRYMHPSDINTTICGDGKSLRSGYSFILGGWNNSKSAILRNGEVVAETTDVVLPDPNARDLTAHRAWSRIRIEKFGNHISMYYEKKLVLEYTDPDPLPGGRIGLWSFHNEPVAGRVRLWYSDEGAPSVVRKPEVRVTQLEPVKRAADATEIFDDFEQDAGEWGPLDDSSAAFLALDSEGAQGDGSCLRVTNQQEGESFAVAAVTTPFEVTKWPRLSFDYRFSPDAHVNLYLRIDDRWQAVTLSAEQMPWDGVPVIGEVPDFTADGQWHHAEVDLQAGLQEAYEGFIPATVTQVAFSAPWESYVLCGIGGNGRGATYWIDNFRIGPAE